MSQSIPLCCSDPLCICSGSSTSSIPVGLFRQANYSPRHCMYSQGFTGYSFFLPLLSTRNPPHSQMPRLLSFRGHSNSLLGQRLLDGVACDSTSESHAYGSNPHFLCCKRTPVLCQCYTGPHVDESNTLSHWQSSAGLCHSQKRELIADSRPHSQIPSSWPASQAFYHCQRLYI